MLSGWSLGAIALGFLLPATAAGQYFGRQKVQYEDFDWRVFNTQHFEVHFYPSEQQITNDAGRMAERWYTRLSRAFQHEFKQKPLIFYADHPDFQQTNVISSSLSEGTGGVTEGLRNRVIMPYTGVYRDNDHVLGHELVHVFQYDLASSPGGGGLAGMGRLPLWLVEGMAEYLSLGRDDPHTAMWLRDAALRGELPTIDQLTRDTRFFPYRYGQALWAYIAGRWGDRAVTELYRFSTRAGWEGALQRVLGTNNERLSQDWIASIRATYLPVIAGRQRPQDAGDRVLYSDDIGAMHLSPVVSPDGRYVAYYARHDLFSIDLYVADAVTGKVVKKLTNPNRTPHFDALSFISSSGTWSPDGQKFAFPVFDGGDMRLTIYDVDSESTDRKIEIQEVGAIQNPSWSPDGSRIAFSGMKGGVSDLYILDLATGVARQVTNDRYADLQPTWSPDGRTIAFVTDRGPQTDFETLTFGEMNIALLDLSTNEVRTLQIFEGAKHINPQFSPDGRDLYFISDRKGFSDIYRIPVTGGQAYQITRLATGASGITALSPAMSVAQRSGRMLFSVFENSGYNVYGVDAERTIGTPVQAAPAVASVAGILPPTEALGEGLVADYLADPMTGLPAQMTFAAKEYNPKLRLDYLGQPSFGVGIGGYTGGFNVGGGISAYFSDMMGDHNLITVLQANGTLKDVGGQAIYQNMEHRINWAALVGHIPYLTPYLIQSTDVINGQPVYRVDEILDRIFIDQAIGYAHYPFSTTRRLEFNTGFTRYSFDREVNTYYIAPSGDIIDEIRGEQDVGDPINLVQAGAALVGDNSYFGFTSPLSGQRYRMEVTPTFGSLTYQSVYADYRRYLFFKPTSLAFRALHIGRYGADGEDPRLSALFLGYETLVRGYDQNSFDVDECTRTLNNSCPEFNRLVGSRIAVANIEWRIPLVGTEELGLVNLPIIPVEIAPFFDAGLAWTRDSSPNLTFARISDERVPVFSTGITSRFNLLGYIILEMYYAYPFQRPDKGWHFGFNIAPGW